jgi:FkbH-like protein
MRRIKELEYPFNPAYLLKKRRSIRRELLNETDGFLEKRIAILGGSTTHDIKEMLELFLLNEGIIPVFYESEYEQYWQDAMFGNAEFDGFHPDVVFIHTTGRNITSFPTVRDSEEEVEAKLESGFEHFSVMWEKLMQTQHCTIIQNNFEMPSWRLLGNTDASDIHGRLNFIERMNERFHAYAREHDNFLINDIHWLSASIGLEIWSNPSAWHLYKYALSMEAIPYLAFNLSNIIKSIFGKNKKAIAVDLDNTLWGGVVGDDDVDGIEIGHEMSMGQAYSEFQAYLKSHKDIGVILAVNSKNDYENAIAGLNHPEGTLKPDDFVIIKANWENKDKNLSEIASDLNLGVDSIVFLDDNPAERGIVTAQLPRVVAPELDRIENYIRLVDRSGFFEVIRFTEDDFARNDMYKANVERHVQEAAFDNYEDYLLSLGMTATIKDFDDIYLARITQLTNKSNQFNLTTKRYTQDEMQKVAADPSRVRLYGKLSDKYGDNGVISVVIGRKDDDARVLHIELWLMSCRVLKRNMEHAMLDALVDIARCGGCEEIRGYYYKTAKNSMVKDFFGAMGFTLVDTNGDDTIWSLSLSDYEPQNNVIEVNV